MKHPESPGEFCFPPLASLITGGSHLLLALLERLVTDRGGTYAMEDTDSMAIVAIKDGGLVPCPGGPYRTEDGREAIRALTWEQVREIVALLDRLNPYDREAVKEPILKIEDDNFDPKTEEAAAAVVPGDFRQALRAVSARSQRRAGAAAEGRQQRRERRGSLVRAWPRAIC